MLRTLTALAAVTAAALRSQEAHSQTGPCVWRQSDWGSEHFDVALAPVVPPTKD
jgi:hypothetical protein